MATTAQDEFNDLMRNKERRTAHPNDENNDARSFLNLSDDEHDDDATPPASQVDPDESARRPSLSAARSTIPRTRYGANTGPKGVISDAQNWQDSRRMHRVSMRSTASLASQAQSALTLRHEPSPAEKLAESDEEYDDDGEGDDDFMRKWRQSRLREMQTSGAGSRMQGRERKRRLFGGLMKVDCEGYLDAVDQSPEGTVVVVYIYDDSSEVSTEIEACIRALASKHPDTRFVKLHYLDAEMERAGVPALLAYRGGQKFAGLVPVLHEIPDDADLSPTTLEVLLRRHQILR